MDEPLSNLDAKLRNQMRAEIIKLRQRINTTFISVSYTHLDVYKRQVIWLLYWISRRREEGFWRDFISNCAFCLVFFVALPAAIYYASYYYYGTAKGLEGGLGMYFTKDYADIVLHNQVYICLLYTSRCV